MRLGGVHATKTVLCKLPSRHTFDKVTPLAAFVARGGNSKLRLTSPCSFKLIGIAARFPARQRLRCAKTYPPKLFIIFALLGKCE